MNFKKKYELNFKKELLGIILLIGIVFFGVYGLSMFIQSIIYLHLASFIAFLFYCYMEFTLFYFLFKISHDEKLNHIVSDLWKQKVFEEE